MTLRLALSVLLMTSCAQKTSSPPVSEAAQTTTTPTAKADHPWVDLERRLLARHPEDVPTGSQIAHIERVDEGLIWLGAHAQTMLVRARALELLGQVPSPRGVVMLQTLAADATQTSKLRAAAVLGLGHLDLAAHPDAVATLSIVALDADTRVASDAARALVASPAADAAVQQLLALPALSAEVRHILARPITTPTPE